MLTLWLYNEGSASGQGRARARDRAGPTMQRQQAIQADKAVLLSRSDERVNNCTRGLAIIRPYCVFALLIENASRYRTSIMRTLLCYE